METGHIGLSIGAVMLAGMVSFLSPCVFPIVPAYLSLISGMSFEEMQAVATVKHARWRLFGGALAFVFGFSLISVFMLWGIIRVMGGVGDGWISAEWKTGLRWAGGAVIALFALHMIGVLRVKAFFNERRFHVDGRKLGYLGAVLAGAAFAFGWSPCLGPILGSVAALAAGAGTEATVWGLLIAYTLGLAVPFLLAALFVDLFLGSMSRITRHMRVIEIFSGVLLLVMAVLLVTDSLAYLSEKAGFLATWSIKLEGMLK